MKDWLKNEWQNLAFKYCNDADLILKYWEEISTQYSNKSRHYHNLTHIHNMLFQVETFQSEITNL